MICVKWRSAKEVITVSSSKSKIKKASGTKIRSTPNQGFAAISHPNYIKTLKLITGGADRICHPRLVLLKVPIALICLVNI